MGDETRLRRPDPERTGPIRSFGKTFSPQWPGEANRETSASGTVSGSAGRTAHWVELAYQVIDKHINDGRRAAAQLNGQHYSTRPATDRLQEVIERSLRLASELLPLWLEALASAVSIDPPRVPSASQSTVADKSDGVQRGVAIAIEMAANRPVTVLVDLREHSEQMPLVTLGLRAVDPGKPELSDIQIEPDEAGRLRFRIRVPPCAPSGNYCGVIVNRETGESRGMLTLRIADP